MGRLLSFLFLFLLGLPAHAANIHKGNVEVSGSFDLSKTYGSGYDRANSSRWSVMGGAQYFFRDRFSLGLNSSFATDFHGSSLLSLGPVATYYFPLRGNAAAFVMLNPLSWSRLSGDKGLTSSALRLGEKFFFTDSVAFGPAFQYQHIYRNGGRNAYSLLGVFSLHL
jgi:hypothetical protein